MNLDVDRHPDWMKTPGQVAELTVGPFVFWIATQDGLSFGFGMKVWRWSWGWQLEELG
jgi:hypothetical protein